jgi:hypothetical protein
VCGGALVVEITRYGSFSLALITMTGFCLLDDNERLHPTALTGRVVQASYDPFFNPERARAEEFGDVLAEGLYWLLDQGQSISEADRRQWESFLIRRRRFVLSVLEGVRVDGTLTQDDKARRMDSLHASLARLAEITPELCVEFMEMWRQDRAEWQRHAKSVYTPGARLEDALRKLTTNYGPGLTWVERERAPIAPS